MKIKTKSTESVPITITIDRSQPGATELLRVMEKNKSVTIKQSQNRDNVVRVRICTSTHFSKQNKNILRNILPISLGKNSDKGFSKHSYAVVLK